MTTPKITCRKLEAGRYALTGSINGGPAVRAIVIKDPTDGSGDWGLYVALPGVYGGYYGAVSLKEARVTLGDVVRAFQANG